MDRPVIDPSIQPRPAPHETQRHTPLALRPNADLIGLRVMVFAPHPDDETTYTGAIIRDAAERGALVTVVVATDGSDATILDPALATMDNYLAQAMIRSREFDAACEALGCAQWQWLGHVDSGMAGSIRSAHPMANINLPEEQAVAEMVAAIRRGRPQVVIMPPPDGNYGHPDHIATHRRAALAVAAAADRHRFPGLGRPWSVSKTYWTMSPFRPAPTATTSIDARHSWSWVKRAFQAHASQMAPDWEPLALPEAVARERFGVQRLQRVTPGPTAPPAVPEHSLAAGLRFSTLDRLLFRRERHRLDRMLAGQDRGLAA